MKRLRSTEVFWACGWLLMAAFTIMNERIGGSRARTRQYDEAAAGGSARRRQVIEIER